MTRNRVLDVLQPGGPQRPETGMSGRERYIAALKEQDDARNAARAVLTFPETASQKVH